MSPGVIATRLLAVLVISTLAAFLGCAAGDSVTSSAGSTGPGSGGNGGAGGGGGSGGEGGVSCDADQKPCDGQCVAIDDPQHGCGQGCAPCVLPHATPLCNAGACEVGVCDPGWANCDGVADNGCEVEIDADPVNCGACGNECVIPDAFVDCIAGVCELSSCKVGSANCDGDMANGCEALLEVDPSNCGSCGLQCLPGEQCQGGICGVFCPPGTGNCDGDAQTGCETVIGTIDNCGFCFDDCDLAHATPDCVMGQCTILVCDAGYEDCDGIAANGCEADVQGSSLHCGACGVVCPGGPNATPVCNAGVCGLVCDGGYADCNGDPVDGCEQPISDVTTHCGACNNVCVIPNGTPACVAGSCAISTCNPSFADCNGLVPDGCEVNTSTNPASCGACGNMCPPVANGTPTCTASACDVICNPGFANCNADPADGCEVNTVNNTAHCGACGNVCSIANGAASCVGGACAVGSCAPGWADCNGSPADGCEVSTDTSVPHCGACNAVCATPNATPACAAGSCTIGACNAGFADCDSSAPNGCEINTQTDVTHCGSCGNACVAANGAPGCSGGGCTVASCNAGYADCNLNPADGCEVNTNTSVGHCGGCGNVCSVANGTPGCSGGGCTVASCNAGFANCNNNPADGCEVNTNTSAGNCGSCGNACSAANGTAACSAGGCVIAACNAGFADCNGDVADGCEVNITSTVGHCGGCGNVCSAANGTPACSGGGCTVASCNAGYADCNLNPADGCEVNTNTSVGNCGSCGNTCSVANGTAGCAGGGCTIASCSAGFANCNGSVADGCEVNTNTSAAHCGGCGNACNIANGTGACSAGGCVVAACNPGFADCNGNPADGCEVNTGTSVANCGACGNLCTISNGTGTCAAGSCAVAACNPGFGDCNGNPTDGCEVNTGTNAGNCGACGNACTTANGTPGCSGGSCTVASCNPGWGDCNGNAADGCETNTGASTGHCGTCGNVCSTANGTPACTGGSCTIGSCNAGFASCNGMSGDGCEVNITTDAQNCGGCGNSCGSVCVGNVAATTCNAGMCGVSACNPNYYNLDGACANGCECLAATNSSSCNLPTSLATVNLGQTITHSSNLVPAGKENWYTVSFTGNTSTAYKPRIRFTTNPGNAFAFDIRRDCAGTALACGIEGGQSNNITDWEVFKVAANGYNQVIPPVGNNGTVLVRVFRKPGFAVTCDSFTLTISN